MITRVGPSYGRSMLKGALKSININACTHRIARAAVLVDPESHELRVQVKILKMFHKVFPSLLRIKNYLRIKQEDLIRCHTILNILVISYTSI
jgi:hypothetical protein